MTGNSQRFAVSTRWIILIATCSSLLAAACGGDDGDGNGAADAADPGELMLRGACPLETKLGGFAVEIHPEFSFIDGDVSNGVVPVTILEETLVDGDCQLLRRNNPFCDPPCQASSTCDFDGSCIALPIKQDIGTVTVRGLVQQEVVLEPVQPTNDYFAVNLPHPLFNLGDEITLTTTDGFYGEMTMFGVGGDVLVPMVPQWNIVGGAALAVDWEPPVGEVRTRTFLRLTIDQHGNTPLSLQCDFDDDGSGEISPAVIDALLGAGISGFPNGTLTRRTVDRVEVRDGCVEMSVALPIPQDVRVSGHTPCNVPMDCPMGQACDVPNQTCI